MPRKRIIPDDLIFPMVQRLLETGGEMAVSFGTVSTATGLAPSTLVQRYGSLAGMLRATRHAAWDALETRTAAAIAASADKGPQGLFKAIGMVRPQSYAADLDDPELAVRAESWRKSVETALEQRLGGSQKAREAAAGLFAAWQGQALWGAGAEDGFRLKDMAKRLV